MDFGRFCTGFLVVMGVGMCHIIAKLAGVQLWEGVCVE